MQDHLKILFLAMFFVEEIPYVIEELKKREKSFSTVRDHSLRNSDLADPVSNEIAASESCCKQAAKDSFNIPEVTFFEIIALFEYFLIHI
jgi:hypothetical protein